MDYEQFLSTGSADFQWPVFAETTTMGLCYTSGESSLLGNLLGRALLCPPTLDHTCLVTYGKSASATFCE